MQVLGKNVRRCQRWPSGHNKNSPSLKNMPQICICKPACFWIGLRSFKPVFKSRWYKAVKTCILVNPAAYFHSVFVKCWWWRRVSQPRSGCLVGPRAHRMLTTGLVLATFKTFFRLSAQVLTYVLCLNIKSYHYNRCINYYSNVNKCAKSVSFIIPRFLVDYGRNLYSHLLAFQTEDWSKIKKRYTQTYFCIVSYFWRSYL